MENKDQPRALIDNLINKIGFLDGDSKVKLIRKIRKRKVRKR